MEWLKSDFPTWEKDKDQVEAKVALTEFFTSLFL